MVGCDRCQGDDNLGYSCNYCSGSFCGKHRLPEKHNCPGLRTASTQGPDFREMFNSDSGILGKVFDDKGEDDAIARERHPGMKTYDGDLKLDSSSGSGEQSSVTDDDPDPSPDVEPDGCIGGGGFDGASTSSGSDESRLRLAALTGVGLAILAIKFPFRVLFNLPSYLSAFNRWLVQLLGSLYGLARTIAPVVVLLVGVLFIAGLVGTGVPAIDDTASEGAGFVSGVLDTDRSNREHAIEQAIHQEVNDVRSERGLETLTFDHSVAAVARNHSEDMATRDYFSHENPDGETGQDRLAAAGISCRSTGENLYTEEGYGTTPDTVAERVVENWLGSSGHRENLLRRGWSLEGVGVNPEGDELWVTQVFCG